MDLHGFPKNHSKAHERDQASRSARKDVLYCCQRWCALKYLVAGPRLYPTSFYYGRETCDDATGGPNRELVSAHLTTDELWTLAFQTKRKWLSWELTLCHEWCHSFDCFSHFSVAVYATDNLGPKAPGSAMRMMGH